MRDSRRGSIQKCSWTPEEDQILTELVRIHGPKKWSLIAHSLRGRIGKQCRERWHNHLNPEVRKDAWSPEEDALIFDLVEKYGTKWATIAKTLVGRTDNAIKNRYYSSLKKHHDQQRRVSGCTESNEPASNPTLKRRRSSQSTSSDDIYGLESNSNSLCGILRDSNSLDAISESSEDVQSQGGLAEELGLVERSPKRRRRSEANAWTHMFSLNGIDASFETFSPDSIIASLAANNLPQAHAVFPPQSLIQSSKVPGAGRAYPGQRRLLPLARVHRQTVLKFHEMQSSIHAPLPSWCASHQITSVMQSVSASHDSMVSDKISTAHDTIPTKSDGIEALEPLSLISEYNILLEFQ